MKSKLTLTDVVKDETTERLFAGYCACGEKVYDLISRDNLYYTTVHESAINKIMEGGKNNE